jgi:peroxiredoxin Q/BCP
MANRGARATARGVLMTALLATATVYGAMANLKAQAPPAMGEKARDFTLVRLDGASIRLTDLTKQGPVVMLMLRGWVGYQCPICTRQVGEFLKLAKEFEAAGSSVVLVYPGEAGLVQGKAEDFITGQTLPPNFHFVVDPDLKVVNLYNLRWDAPNETAYPSTFVFDSGGVSRFAKISQSHGDRSSGAEVLKVVRSAK